MIKRGSDEKVDHPIHYNMGGEIGEDGSAEYEVIKLIEDLGWGFEFCMGNALKYTLRAPHKEDETGDLQKARWYLERARKHYGRVRAFVFRKLSMTAAIRAWKLLPEPPLIAVEGRAKDEPDLTLDVSMKYRLAIVVEAIAAGDPFEALNNLNVYMVRFGPGG